MVLLPVAPDGPQTVNTRASVATFTCGVGVFLGLIAVSVT